MNRALVAKLGWFINTRQQAFWVRTLRAKYLHDFPSLRTASKKPQRSWIWQGILECRDILDKGLIYAVNNGSGINIWSDPWICPFYLLMFQLVS